ncbi:MAG TPA: tetratricopeptide repeat protein, partial [Ktedonobacteraceae bacterium]|nr:tetratricopeptide repeat protein [Ktedonobacteraceae bacterium]
HEALIAYNQAIRLDLDCASAYKGKGLALFTIGQFAEALEAFDQAIHLNPDLASVYFNRGDALFILGQFAEALASYDKGRQHGEEGLETEKWTQV